MPRTISQSLAHAVTAYDRRQAKRAYYNPNALAIYVGRAQDVAAEVANGADLSDAVSRGFCDRLLTAVVKVLTEDGHLPSPQP